ncbi:MAG: MBOAT family protein [Cellulosilyticum sp.]|nr:MBOAT family protein [Cellulosilyticum sp.]
MLFSSTFFLYVFLPLVLIIYYGLCKKQDTRNKLLLITSLIFYAWGEPKFVIVMLVSILANYYLGLLVDRARNTPKVKIYLATMVVFNLTIMGIFKYLGFVVQSINDVASLNLTVPQIALPIGISFFTFQSISYVIDVYRGHGKVLKSPLDVGLYIAFFPQLIAGPIVRYETIANEIHGRRETESDFADGIVRFIIGLSKKVLLSNQFALIADKAYALEGAGSLTVGFAWLGAVSYMLQIYFDFGGYSDMAIGLGKMFGFHFNENFNFPYIANSVSDFWRRWHISLSTWFRDYVYIPLGGNRGSKLNHLRNILIVWTLTGIWHGANWTFIAWGFFFGVILIIEKFTGLGKLMSQSKVIGHVYTLFLILISWVLFRADSIGQALSYIGHMFGIGDTPLSNDLTHLYFTDNLYILVIGILTALPFSKLARERYQILSPAMQKVVKGLAMIALIVLFFVSVSYLVKGTYNPFIYFNF